MTERQSPRFTGISTYQDRLGRFSIRYPSDWLMTDLEGWDGAALVPNPQDPYTAFTAGVTALQEPVVAEDIEELKAGVSEGLLQLADCKLEETSELVLGNLIRFERIFTFTENGIIRKRKLWLLYLDKWLIRLTWQGSSEPEYEYWLALANYSFATLTLPEAHWYATDRDLPKTVS